MSASAQRGDSATTGEQRKLQRQVSDTIIYYKVRERGLSPQKNLSKTSDIRHFSLVNL